MTAILERCASLVTKRGRLVAIVWGVVILVSLPLAAQENKHLSNGGFVSPSSESAKVSAALPQFKKYNADALVVVLSSKRENNAQPVLLAQLHRVLKIIHGVRGVSVTPKSLNSAEEQSALLPALALPLHTSDSEDVQDNLAVTLRGKLSPGATNKEGVTTYFLGQAALFAALDELSKKDLIKAESVGLPLVLLILLLVFGAFAAAALPLGLGVVAIVVSGAGLYLLSLISPVSIFASNMASLLGIGVAVDYSLFMLSRYQRELRGGATQTEAITTAMGTSGYAILVSGLTVLVSLAGLFLVNSTVVRSMAAAAVMVVLVAVAGALTLTPPLMRRYGNRYAPEDRLFTRPRNRWRPQQTAGKTSDEFWSRWARQVMRRPVTAVVGSTAVLLVLAIPALSIKVDDAALNQFPSSADVVVGTRVLNDTFGPGIAGPIQVVISLPLGASPPARAAAQQAAEAILRSHPELKPPKVEVSADGRQLLVSAVPRVAPDSETGHRIVSEVRTQFRHGIGSQTTAAVGGTTAQIQDYNSDVSGSLWRVGLAIAVLTFLVLVFLLRSIVLPLKAVLMTALTVAASYGVLVVFFQWRWFDSLIGSGPHYLGTLTPPFVLALTFGLSMDYQVFLLARIKEEYEKTWDNALAVERGLASSAATISSAAVIMVFVFLAFAFVSMPSIRELGIGLAFAIAVDATLVRLVLVPAAMQLLGHWNWWFPFHKGSSPSPVVPLAEPARD